MARIEVIRSGLDRWSLKTLAGFDVGCRDFIRTRTGDSGSGRSHERLAPEEGLEPSTHRLTADCSTIELLWNARRRRKLAVGISLRQRAFVADFAAWMAEKLKWGRDRLRGAGEACRGDRLRGTVPALAGRLGEGLGFRALREGRVCSPSMLAPARSRCRRGVWGYLGDRLTRGTGCRQSGHGSIGYGLERGSLWFRLWP